MNLKIKAILMACLMLAALVFVSGCSGDATPYAVNDSENYTVSVKFDANGGYFTTNTSVIVDSFNISEMKADGSGKVQIPLIAPDDAARGKDAFTPVKNGYFLAGWYAQKTATNFDGKEDFTYNKRWDFAEDRLEISATASYTSAEPVLTLYAVWAPLFEVQIYDLATGDYLDSVTYNPNETEALQLPTWDEETGAIEMYRFPERDGYTYGCAYYDAEGTSPAVGETLYHTGKMDYETGTAIGHSMKLYVDWMEGEWYHIYTAEQFVENASVNGNYVIHADLDFAEEIWPTVLMYGNFNGTIQGNGFAFRNIKLEQTNNSKLNAGLFGTLTEEASISDVTFDNAAFTIKAGTRVVGTCYGLLAGTISDSAALTGVTITNSFLQIDSGCHFGVEDYVIGLVSGMGDSGIDASGITCQAVGADPDSVNITVSGETVTVTFVSE